jgi:ubiquinone/menaquinone biosynthesis C-methylase UbiE
MAAGTEHARPRVPPRRQGGADTLARYERIARFYDLLDLPFEHFRYRPLRRRLFAGLSGRLLDAGVGTGRNMPFYPPGAEVVGIDLSPAMLRRAEARRKRLGVAAELRQMDVTRRTPFPDGHFDAIVATFLFCVLDESQQAPALNELARICKPGGTVRLLEYVYPNNPIRRAVMRAWAPWVRWAYGAAFDRDTERRLAESDLRPVQVTLLPGEILKLIEARPRRSPE